MAEHCELPASPFVYAITDRKPAGGRPIGGIVAELCDGGVGIIQLREKGLTTREFCAVAAEALAAARAAGALLIVNDRVDVALITGADGVHLGDDDLPPADARRVLGGGKIIGVSCHGPGDVRSADGEPVDYIAVGPVFHTVTKELKYPAAGTELVRQARLKTSKPLIAIGGIDAGNAADVIRAGADGVAVISALMSHSDIGRRARELIRAVRE